VEVSKELSEAPNKGAGGALGFLARKDLPSDFEKAVWTQKVGTATPPVAAGSGFHIFRVEERLEGRTVTFEEAKAALRLAVAEQKASRTLETLLKESQERNPVSVLEDHLPFPYVGKLPKRATN
jgi:parvulin-like peptidyl-prolyl isomerase